MHSKPFQWVTSYVDIRTAAEAHYFPMTPLTRIQLFLLAAMAVLLVWRLSTPEAAPDGFLQLSDLDNKRLYEQAFELEKAASIRVDVRGAYENDATDASLAAYGWIVDAKLAEPVWIMSGLRSSSRDILVTEQDEIQLEAGRYVAYFAALGPSPESWDDDTFLGLTPHWKHYRDKFYMSLSTEAEVSLSNNTTVDIPSADEHLWSVRGVGNRARKSVFIRVQSESPVHIQAVSEWCASGCDVARLTDLETGRAVWELTMENSEPAGGWNANRVFSGAVLLDRGVYQATFETDRRHDANRWIANPPYVPARWGMSLTTSAEDLAIVDPWADEASRPAVSLLEVSSGVREQKSFTVQRPVLVLIHAVGEIGTDGTLYDYAKLVDADRGDVIWSMSREASEPAGGHTTNRSQSGVLRLSPGTYQLSYQTDDSHAWNDWRKSRPRNPERWGVALFTLDPSADEALTLQDEAVLPGQVAQEGNQSGAVLVRAERVPNDVQIQEEFTLSGASTVYIRASGEISRQGRYDYGWIESVSSGETVWEMTLDNTVHAGGDDRNRIFDGSLELPAGAYRVHFVTDFDYAWGDFDTDPPKYPDAWGITVMLQ